MKNHNKNFGYFYDNSCEQNEAKKDAEWNTKEWHHKLNPKYLCFYIFRGLLYLWERSNKN